MFKQPGCDVDLSVISVLEHDIEHLRNSEINWVYSKKCNSQLLTAHFLSIKPCNSLQREDELGLYFLSLKLDR